MKSAYVEEILADVGVIYHYDPAVPLSKIQEAKTSQSRRGLNPAELRRYTGLMTDGRDFPAIVVSDVGRDQLMIEDGLHRFGAAEKSSREFIDAYVVERPTPGQEAELQIRFNAVHGLPMDTPEREAALIKMVVEDQTVQSVADGAAKVGLPKSHADRVVRKARTEQRLEMLGIPIEDIDKMGSTNAQSLAGLHDPVAIRVFQDAKTAGSLGNLKRVITKVRKGKSDADQLEIAAKQAEIEAPTRKATARGQRAIPKDVQKVRRALESITTVNPEVATRGVVLMGEELVIQYTKELSAAAEAIQVLLQMVQDASTD